MAELKEECVIRINLGKWKDVLESSVKNDRTNNILCHGMSFENVVALE